MKKRDTTKVILAALLLLALAPAFSVPAQAQGTSRLFPETGKTVRGAFLQYWNTEGGLARQGFPISNEIREISETDGKPYTVQYFERARLELHPENKAPFQVLSGLLGVWQYNALYGPTGAPDQKPNTAPGSALFPQTNRRVGSAFLQYWEKDGGLTQFGYPISDEFTEISAWDGKAYTVQYFERAVMELHPSEANPAHKVMLSQLGRYRHALLYGSPQLPPAENNRAQVNLAASELFLVWRELETGEPPPDPQYRPLYNLRGMDLRTGRPFPIASTYNEFSRPAISGSLVAWAATDPRCPACDMDIVALDLASGKTTLVATGAAIQYAPAVSGKRVAWIEQTNSSKRLVLVRDLHTANTPTVVGDDEQLGNVNQIAADNTRFVWARATEGTPRTEFVLKSWQSINAPTRTALAPTPYSGPFPRIALSGNKVAVTSNGVKVVDLVTGEARSLVENVATDRIQHLTGGSGVIVWIERHLSENSATLWAYPVEGNANTPVKVDTGLPRDLAISSNRLFYINGGALVSKPLMPIFEVMAPYFRGTL